jgi:hypothetical protein
MQLTGFILAANSRIFKRGRDTGFRVRQLRRVVDSQENDTGYRLIRNHFCDKDENQTGFYIGGCGAVHGHGPIYGPEGDLPWMK